MDDKAIARALRMIANCTDPQTLRQLASNARRKGAWNVVRAAELRLYDILPPEAPGTFEHDAWRSIYALEGTLTAERGRTTRLARTRQKIKSVGELETIKHLILKPTPSEGFFMLVERDMLNLAFEAVALRHPERFCQAVLSAAAARLNSIERPATSA